MHARDHLFPRFQVRLDASGDLSDLTLTAATDLMLAQAAECFYLKAEYDSTSSPVTCQIAALAADYYDIAYKATKQNNGFGKFRFPKVWTSWMHVKQLTLKSVANYHCPNMLKPDVAVGERHARLILARDLAKAALDKCTAKEVLMPREVKVFAETTLDKVTRALDEIDRANFEDFHQTVLSRDQLRPLRKPPQTLVSSVNVFSGQSCGSVTDLIYQGRIRDIFEGVVGIMCMSSGYVSGLPQPGSIPELALSTSGQASLFPPVGGMRHGSMHSLVNSMQPRGSMAAAAIDSRRSSMAAGVSSASMEEVKKFVLEAKKVTAEWSTDLKKSLDLVQPLVKDDTSALTKALDAAEDRPTDMVMKRAKALLNTYFDCENINKVSSTREICASLDQSGEWISNYLRTGQKQLWQEQVSVLDQFGSSATMKVNPSQRVQEWMSVRQLIRKVSEAWFASTNEPMNPEEFGNFNPRDLRVKMVELIQKVRDEGFVELFKDGAAAPSDLHWSESKIKTVVPCIDSEYQERYQNTINLLNAIWNQFQGSKRVPLPSNLYAAFASVTERYLELREKAIGFEDRLEASYAFLMEFQNIWCGQDQKDNGFSGQKRIRVLDMLIDTGKHVAADASASKDTLIMLGIEESRKSLMALAKDAADVLEEVQMVQSQLTVSKSSVASEIQTLALNIARIAEDDANSEKIVTVFEQQLVKWKTWRHESQDHAHKLVDFRQWLQATFGKYVSDNTAALSRRTSNPAVNQQFGMSPNQVDLFQSLVDEQQKEEIRQIDRSYNVAEAAVAALNQQGLPSSRSSKPTPGASPQIQRRQMLRKISVTASALERQARSINEQMRRTDANIDNTELNILREELLGQMRAMQQQHQNFLQQSQGSQEDRQSPRRGSEFIQSAKHKLLQLIGKRPSMKGDQVIHELTIRPVVEAPRISHLIPDEQQLTSQFKRFSVDSGYGRSNTDLAAAPTAPPLHLDELVRENAMLRHRLSEAAAAPKNELPTRETVHRRKSIPRKPVQKDKSPGRMPVPFLGAQENPKHRPSLDAYLASRRNTNNGKQQCVESPQHETTTITISTSNPGLRIVTTSPTQEFDPACVAPLDLKPRKSLSRHSHYHHQEDKIEQLGDRQNSPASDGTSLDTKARRRGYVPLPGLVKSKRPSFATRHHSMSIPQATKSYENDVEVIPRSQTSMGLKDGIESVSKYFAWNRSGYEDFEVQRSAGDEDVFNIARRGSLGGEPFIP